MQQMHQGQLAGPPNPIDQSQNNLQNIQQRTPANPGSPGGGPGLGSPLEQGTAPNIKVSSLDDLVSGAAKDADKAAASAELKTETPKAQQPQEDKKGKKEKEKNMRLVYSDKEVSPEEKMSQMPRYAFNPSG